MSDSLVTGRASRDDCRPLGERLQKVGAGTLKASQVICDERLQRWIAAVLQLPAVGFDFRKMAPPLLVLTVRCAQGELRVATSERALPLSAACALGLADRALACEVLTEVLGDMLRRFVPVLSEARILAFERRERATAGFMLDLHGQGIALCGADRRLLSHVADLLPQVNAEVVPWGGLAVRARLRLAVRLWSPAFIRSLAAGDVVLLGGAANARHQLIIGTGYTMQADTQLSLESERVETRGEARMAPDQAGTADAGGGQGHVEDLQLPVAFEIDTARVSLAELASMRPGYIVELDAPLSQAVVRLVCHGQVVGQGQLLAVGEQLGVRIVRMGIDRVAAAGR